MNFSGIWNGAKSITGGILGSRLGRRAVIGAGIGGAYGGYSDNGSVLGGAAMGAGIGGASSVLGSAGSVGFGAYKRGMAGGMGRMDALKYAGSRVQRGAKLYGNMAVNGFKSTLKGWGI